MAEAAVALLFVAAEEAAPLADSGLAVDCGDVKVTTELVQPKIKSPGINQTRPIKGINIKDLVLAKLVEGLAKKRGGPSFFMSSPTCWEIIMLLNAVSHLILAYG